MIQSLCSTGLESTYDLYPSLSKFLCLLEIEEASTTYSSYHSSSHSHSTEDLSFLKDWQDRLSFLNSDFQFVEPVLAVRCSVLHQLLQVGVAETKAGGNVPIEQTRRVERMFEALHSTLLCHSRQARESANYQVRFDQVSLLHGSDLCPAVGV